MIEEDGGGRRQHGKKKPASACDKQTHKFKIYIYNMGWNFKMLRIDIVLCLPKK